MKKNSLLTIALHDLKRWRKMPLTAVCALIPPIAMTLVLVTLSLAVTQQPVALVVQGNGPASMRMAQIIQTDTDEYYLTVTNATTANKMLNDQTIAAVITIPPTFDQEVTNGTGKVLLTINNVDFDFSDDIRRSVDRSIVEFDAPTLVSDEPINTSLSNVYHVTLDAQYIRETTVDWEQYQLVPTFVLLILNVGLVGTALLCALDKESKTALILALSPQRSWVLGIWPHFRRSPRMFRNRPSSSIGRRPNPIHYPSNCTVTGIVRDIFGNSVMRIRHRSNNRDMRKRHKIRSISLLNDRHLPVPIGRRLHCNRISSPLAPEFKRVHPHPVLHRRTAASLVLPQPHRTSILAPSSCALRRRLRRSWRIPHETLLDHVKDLSGAGVSLNSKGYFEK